MRITTGMLDASAAKAGIAINGNSLLDYIHQRKSLFDSVGKSSSLLAGFGGKQYEKLQKSAEQLKSQAELFMEDGGDSIIERLKRGETDEEIYTGIEKLVEYYNGTCEALSSVSGTLNEFYLHMMKEAASDQKEALNEIGITVTKSGALQLDREKLKAADAESILKVFGADGSFAERTAFLAERISDNAKVNVQCLSNQYNASGNLDSSYQNKYDLWG